SGVSLGHRVPALGRVVGIGCRAEDDAIALPRPPAELASKDLDDVRLDPNRATIAIVRRAIGPLLEASELAEVAAMGAAHVRVERPAERHAAHAVESGPARLLAVLGRHVVRLERMFDRVPTC